MNRKISVVFTCTILSLKMSFLLKLHHPDWILPMYQLSTHFTFFMYFLYRDFNVSIPSKTKNNGTLYVHVLLLPRDKNDFSSHVRYSITRITTHTVPQAEAFNLMGNKGKVRYWPLTHQGITHLNQTVKDGLAGLQHVTTEEFNSYSIQFSRIQWLNLYTLH